MPDTLEDLKDFQRSPDRRSHARHQVRSLAYIDLDEGNGGIVLNVSESGVAVQAVTPLIDEFLPQIRLQLSQSTTPIIAAGQIVWTTNSKKVAGIRFLDFPPAAAGQIRDWIASEAFPLDSPRETNFPAEAPRLVSDSAINEVGVADESQTSAPATEAEDHGPVSPTAIGPVLVHLEAHTSDPTPSRSNQASIHAIPVRSDSAKDAKPKAEAAPEISPVARREEERPNWLLYALIGVLAVCSTAAGWSVGRTGLYGALAKLRTVSSDPGAPAIPSSPSIIAKLPGIEIVDLNNRRWIVPFAGASSDVSLAPHPLVAVSQPTQPQKAKSPGRVWTLSSSVRPTAAAKPHRADADIPPALSNQAPGSASGGAPLAAISGVGSALPPIPSDPSLLSSGVVQPALLIHRVEPIYPNNATQFYSTDATIKLHVTIGTDGQVQTVNALSGPPIFYQAATSAIHQWRYRPAMVNGKPSVSDGEISIVFRRP